MRGAVQERTKACAARDWKGAFRQDRPTGRLRKVDLEQARVPEVDKYAHRALYKQY